MFEIRRTAAVRAAEQAMPESLSVAFGAYLDDLAADPWAASDPWSLTGAPDQPARVGTFGLGGRGMVTFLIQDVVDDPHVVLTQLNF